MLPQLSFTAGFHKPHPKARFTASEDELLTKLVEDLGSDDWQVIAAHLRGRNARQCRDRWTNYLSPAVGNGPWTADEDHLLMQKYSEFGAFWKHIASFFRSRTDINVKSRWHLLHRRLRKRESKQILQKVPKAIPKPKPKPLPAPDQMCQSGPFTLPLPTDLAPPPPPKGDALDLWASLMINEESGFDALFDGWD
jgi:hypothetical protein